MISMILKREIAQGANVISGRSRVYHGVVCQSVVNPILSQSEKLLIPSLDPPMV